MTFEPAALRKDYLQGSVDESTVDASPYTQFALWLNDAIAANLIEANAMIVATVDAAGIPSARTVLLKDVSEDGFIFSTSYESHKGRDLAGNPNIALLFYWPALERQVRITGTAHTLTADESDEIYGKRPVDARISALVSPQSQVIPGREWLENRFQETKTELNGHLPQRPDTWGGYRVVPVSFEFWQGRKNRLHDRIRYRQDESGWIIERVAP